MPPHFFVGHIGTMRIPSGAATRGSPGADPHWIIEMLISYSVYRRASALPTTNGLNENEKKNVIHNYTDLSARSSILADILIYLYIYTRWSESLTAILSYVQIPIIITRIKVVVVVYYENSGRKFCCPF